MQTVTLQAQDFKTVHNTLCDLRNLAQRMAHSQIKIEDVQQIIDSFEQGLADAYRQDDEIFSSKMDYFDSVKTQENFSSVWSIYEVSNLDEAHPYTGAKEVVYREHWGAEPVTVAIGGNTWRDLYRAADCAIRNSGDAHHYFIESFEPYNTLDSKFALELVTGS